MLSMGYRQQIWVSWSADVPLIDKMGDAIGILRMVVVILFFNLRTINLLTIQIRNYSAEKGR